MNTGPLKPVPIQPTMDESIDAILGAEPAQESGIVQLKRVLKNGWWSEPIKDDKLYPCLPWFNFTDDQFFVVYMDAEPAQDKCRYGQHDETGRCCVIDASDELPRRYYEITKRQYEQHEVVPAQDNWKVEMNRRIHCNSCGSEFNGNLVEYVNDSEDGEGDEKGICPVCESKDLVEVKRQIEEAGE